MSHHELTRKEPSTGQIIAAKLWQSTTADAFGGFLAMLMKNIGKPVTLILDNASIHKAKKIQPLIKFLGKQGLTLYFLPPYRPELNRIEGLWHKIKHTWMAAKCRNSAMLEADIEEIFSNYGTKYQHDF